MCLAILEHYVLMGQSSFEDIFSHVMCYYGVQVLDINHVAFFFVFIGNILFLSFSSLTIVDLSTRLALNGLID